MFVNKGLVQKLEDGHRELAFISLYCTLHIPLHPNVDFATMHTMEESLHQRGPLQWKGCDQEVEAHTAKAVALQECHEEAETDEDHHMYILEACTTSYTLGKTKEII